ncbi:reverse transcriptase [Ostertagia ostertagi]
MSRSRSSSRSRHRHSSSDSSSSSASSRESERRSRSQSSSSSPSREGSTDRKEGLSYVSPLAPPPPDCRIPRKHEFRSARDEVPAPPAVPQKTLRVRVSITEQARERFDTLAAGVPLSNAERSSLLRELPLVASLFGEVPAIDEQLPRDSDRAILVREPELRTLHETLLNVLNIVELVRKLGADGQGGTFAAPVIGYFEILDTLVSGSLMDLIVLRRERFLKALGVEPRRAMPSYRRLPLAGSTMVHRMRQTLIPDLFGKELRDELAAGDSAITKSLQKLRASAKKRKATPPRQIRNRWAYSYPFLPRSLPLGVSDTILDSHGAQGSSEATIKDPYMYSNRIAGRLADFVKSWEGFSGDPFILESIKGYRIPFGRRKPCLALPTHLSQMTTRALSEELDLLREKGAIERVPTNTKVWVSSLFGIPKKDGSTRPIINLKPLNAFLEIPHFKMENLHSVSDVAYKGDFLAKIDMRDAYFAVNIAADHRNYLAFWWNRNLYRFTCLPFGLATAPYVYTKLMRVVAAHFRERGIRVIHYLDDWAVFANTEEECRSHIAYAIQIFEHLGLCINHAKSQLVPTQELEFLGLIIDARLGEFRIPPKKLDRIRSEASSIAQRGAISARELAAFLGRINFIALASPYSTYMTRRLQREMIKCLDPLNSDSFENLIPLRGETLADMLWFRDKLDAYASHPFTLFSPDITITTDASKAGWGAMCNGRGTGGRWTEQEAARHINVLELQAAFFGLQAFGNQWRDTSVLLEMDNTSAISYLKRRGGTTSEELSDLAQQIGSWCWERRIRLLATHRPGEQNLLADTESRSFTREVAEWSLDSSVSQQIFSHLGRPTVDLFASRLNHKLKPYFSLNPDPGAAKVDAFAHKWSATFGYAFPPFNLIGRVLRKAVRDGATLILVTPLWRTRRAAASPAHMREPTVTDQRSGAGAPSTIAKELQVASLEDLATSWASAGCNKQAINTLLASWAPSTRRQYASSLSKWHEYLLHREPKQEAVSHITLCNFLATLADRGLSYSSVASHKAAITTVSDLLFGTSWGENPLVTRFMKGLFRINPPKARYSATWEVDKVLNYITNLGPNSRLPLKQLTLKLTILLALCSPKRVSEIASFSLRSLQRSAHQWVFFIDYRNKNRRFGPPQSAVYEAYLANSLLCPVKTLEQYLAATEKLRGGEQTLLLSYASPHRPISSATVARWIKMVLVEADVGDGFAAHSTRSASTSKAYKQGLSLETIMRAAAWAPGSSTFQDFYRRDAKRESYQKSILRRSSNKESQTANEKTANWRRKRSPEAREKPTTPRSTVKKSKNRTD